MARINIEDTFWGDPRFTRLCILMGDEFKAVGAVVFGWKIAQKFWCPDKAPIPIDNWILARLPDALITCGLAERLDNGIRMRGSEEHFAWWFQRQEAGKRSAVSRKAKNGTSQPRTAVERSLNGAERTATSSSSSSSLDPTNYVSKGSVRGNHHKILTVDDLLQQIPVVQREIWVQKFGDSTFQREVGNAFQFHTLDPAHTPRTVGQWMKKLYTWFEIHATKPKAKAEAAPDNRQRAAILVADALKIYGDWSKDEAAVRKMLGDELYKLAIKAGTHRMRRLPADRFYIPNIAGMLKEAGVT